MAGHMALPEFWYLSYALFIVIQFFFVIVCIGGWVGVCVAFPFNLQNSALYSKSILM